MGNFVSNEAFSAVGTVTPSSICSSAPLWALPAGWRGHLPIIRRQTDGAVKQAVHTSLVMTLVLGVIMTAAGILLTPFLLGLMKTPADVFPEATAYLTIYFSGVMGLMLLQYGAGILRAVGDSKRPFYFLVAAAVLKHRPGPTAGHCVPYGSRGRGLRHHYLPGRFRPAHSCCSWSTPAPASSWTGGPCGLPLHFEADCPASPLPCRWP